MKKLICLLLFCGSLFGQTNSARMLSGVNYQVGGSYAFQPIDVTRVTAFTNSGSISATLSSGAVDGFGAGTIFTVVVQGTGSLLINCIGCTINGSTTLPLSAGQGADIYGDGANFTANVGAGSGGGGGGGGSFSSITTGNNNSAAMSVDTGATLFPINNGLLRADAFAPLTTALTAPGTVSESHCATLGLNAYSWVPLSNGTFAEQECIDTVTASPSPLNTRVIARRTFFNDSMAGGQPGKNAFVSLDHTLGVGTDPTVQDRAWWMEVQTPAGDSGTRKSMAGLQIEMDYNGTVVFSPGPDSEASALSLQVADFHTTNLTSPALGTNAVRASYFRESGAGWYNSPQAVFNGQFDNLSNVAGNSQAMGIFTSKWSDDQALSTAIPVIGFYNRGFTNRFSANIGFDSINMGTSSNDYDLIMEGVNSAGTPAGFSSLIGPTTLGQQIHAASGFQLDILGAIKVKAGSGANQLCFFGSTGGSNCFGPADNAGTPNAIRWPVTTGTSGQCLVSDGGNPQQLSWSSSCISGGGGSGITSLNGLSAAIQNFATVNDTNITLGVSSVTPTHSFTVGFTGTLAAARLNANTPQSVNNDTNITGAISGQVLNLGWAGTLAAARLNANTPQTYVNDTNVTLSMLSQQLTAGWTGQLGVTRGGTGLAAVAAHQLFVGTSANVFTAKTLPDCNGSTNALNYTQSSDIFTCLAITSLVNPMTTLGDSIVGGAGGTPTRVAGPVTPDGVAYSWTSTSVAGVSTQQAWGLPGVGGRSVSGASDTVVCTDRVNWISYTGSSATAIALPQAGTSCFGAHFAFGVSVTGTVGGTGATITAAGTSTFQPSGSSTFVILQGENCTVTSYDNANYFTRCSPGQMSVTSGDLLITRSASGDNFGLATTAVTPASYTTANITVDSKGRITAASNGSSPGGVPNPGANGIVACTGTACSTASARTLVAGAGLGGSNLDGVAGAPSFNTDSTEAAFLAPGTLTCGAGTSGKAEVDVGLFRVCDNTGTPAVLIMANGDSAGKALAGDSATAFFVSGQIEAARGGTNVDTSAATGVAQVSSGAWSVSNALANGTTGTTQTAASNDTKVATDAYVDGHFIANGTSALGTSSISSGVCGTTTTVSATGVVSTDAITWNFNADVSAVTGYTPATTGSLIIYVWPTANNVNFRQCNPTASSITPGAATVNYKVVH